MNILRYRPMSPQDAFRRDLEQAFERYAAPAADGDVSAVATADWVPGVDIREEPSRFVLCADLPGIEPAEIEVSMDKGILTLKGERKVESCSEGEGFTRIERRYGRFHRRFALPDSADAERITATGHQGVLEIVIPKKPETTPRRIQVGVQQASGPVSVQ